MSQAKRARTYDPDKAKKNRDKWREANREKHLANHRHAERRRRFGLTKDEYEKYLTLESLGCSICGGHNPSGKSLCIDHNHDTNQLRGLLCTRCNTAIGLFRERRDVMEKAIAYLRQWELPAAVAGEVW